MSVQAIGWAYRVKTGNATLKTVLVAICNYADERGECWPSQARLARDTELTDRTVRESLAKLEKLGIISRTRQTNDDGYRSSDLIRLNPSYRNLLPVGPCDQPEPPSGRKGNGDGRLPENDYRPTGKSPSENGSQIPTNRQEPSRTVKDTLAGKPAKANVKPIYSEDFTMLWDCVPKDDNPGSKSDAAKSFNKLTAVDKTLCIQGWLAYLDWLEGKRAKRADHPIKQLVSFINGRLWETYLEAREINHG